MVYLCSCSCCSKLRGVSLQKSWQLAGLLAKTLAFWAEERSGLMTVVQDNHYHGNRLQTVSQSLHFQMISLNVTQRRICMYIINVYKSVYVFLSVVGV